MTINRLGGLNPLNNVTSTQKATAKSSIAPQTDTISISDEAKEIAIKHLTSVNMQDRMNYKIKELAFFTSPLLQYLLFFLVQ